MTRALSGLSLLAILFSACASLAAPPHGAGAPGAPGKPAMAAAGTDQGLPTIETKTAGMEQVSGLLDVWLDRDGGKVYLAVPAPAAGSDEVGRYLYIEGLVTGLGSNPVGLDRGQIGPTRVVAFRRVGNRLLIQAENVGFRALSDDPDEVRAVEESFADSVLWGGPLEARDEDGRGLVDITSFLVRDAHGISATLRRTGQGAYALDAGRSAVDFSSCRVFPENLELEAVLTYAAAGEPGKLVARTVPDPTAFTVRQHHSLIKLPDDGYTPRPFDPRSGSYDVSFIDYATPLDKPIRRRWLVRHRLQKVDPTAARSPVVKPLVYYVDRGTPEPVRSALIEGASWWAQAFDAAGFENAFRVELLPEGADPLDVRYNVIEWVHRSTRGWSYGGGVIDPRTGEMIKGHVSLGSLRVRQDRLIFEGLEGTAKTGTGAPDDPVQLALARLRQLAAHETGHTLGLAHNFAASTYGRASVMDYPAPLVSVGPDGDLDFSKAYATGIGAFDIQSIRYAYSEFPPGTDEQAALAAILQENRDRGWVFLTDQDARPPGAAQPLANLWDNGSDPVGGLKQVLAVRRVALDHFDEGNIAAGQPLALLQEVLVPVYFYHRYQLEAATKEVGGLNYRYAFRGDPSPGARPVPAAEQRRALDLVLTTLEPKFLDLPESVLELLQPRPNGFLRNEEMFASATRPAFDALGAAATAAGMTVSGLLQPQRAARLVDFSRRDASLPSLEEVLGAVVEKAFGAPAAGAAGAADGSEARLAEIRRTVQSAVVRSMIDLASNPAATPAVRERTEGALAGLAERLRGAASATGARAAHRTYLADEIDRYLQRQHEDGAPLPAPAAAPPGSPIGSGMGDFSTWIQPDQTDWIGRGCSMDGPF